MLGATCTQFPARQCNSAVGSCDERQRGTHVRALLPPRTHEKLPQMHKHMMRDTVHVLQTQVTISRQLWISCHPQREAVASWIERHHSEDDSFYAGISSLS